METDSAPQVPVYGVGGSDQPISMPLGALRKRLSCRSLTLIVMGLRFPNESSVYRLFVIHETHRIFRDLSNTRRASPVLQDVFHRAH